MTINNSDFTEIDTIHFGCNKCGKCCSTSPNVDFYEMLNLADEFVFTVHHHSHLSKKKTPLEKEIIKQLELLGHTILIPSKESALYYYIDFKAIDFISHNGCSKLVDKQCGIYHKRPSSCKISPLDIRYPENRQWESIQIYKNNVLDKNKNWECSFDEKENIIFSNKEINQKNDNSLYYRKIQNIRNFTDSYIKFLQIDPKKFNSHLECVYKAHLTPNELYSDMVIILKSALNDNLISEYHITEFIDKQLTLIEKNISYATTVKNRQDKTITALYRKQQENYLKSIKENIFST